MTARGATSALDRATDGDRGSTRDNAVVVVRVAGESQHAFWERVVSETSRNKMDKKDRR